MNIYVAIVVGYLVIVVLAGLYLSRREVNSGDDFVVAGRSLPTFVLAGTLLATWCGSGSVVSGASFTYRFGPWASILYYIGEPLGIILMYFIASKIRDASQYTVPQIMEIRYGKTTRLLAALCILIAYIGIASYQFKGAGYILNLITGISPETGTIISAIIIITLALAGGMFSVAYTDAMSAFLIVIALVVALPVTLTQIDGFSFYQQLSESQKSLTGGMSGIQVMGYLLPTLLLMLGDQNLFQRYSSAKDRNVARKSNILFLLSDILILVPIITLSSAAIILFPDITPDTALLSVFMHSIPPVLGGLGLAAATAFIITTGDSFLLSAATIVTYDFFIPFVKPNANQKDKLKITRISILVIGILAYITLQFFPSVLAAQMYSYTIYGAAITPPLLAALFWKKATTKGALTSLVLGSLGTLFWELVLNNPFGWNSVLFSAPLSIIGLIIVSLMTYKETDNVTPNL